MKAATRSGQRGKSIEELVTFAVDHRIRVEALTLLNEGVYSVQQLAALMGQPLGSVSYHVRELLEGGSIELAEIRKVRNADEHFYRAIEMPMYSDDDMEAMTAQMRQVTYGLIIQYMFAETMAAFWAGTLSADRRTCMYWQRFNVDTAARDAIADRQAVFMEEVTQIAQESVNRNAGSNNETTPIVVVQMGFGRAREAPEPPFGNPE
jgi:DNA-binding transcriptional ArsR family regulator